jgi:1-acyl-sn-glycerol-3-phosphate acyltransferase
MSAVRGGSILAAFMAVTVPLMPVQALFVRTSPWFARRLPHWYHRQVCRIIGVRLSIEGEVAKGRPVLLVSNHTSWLDIPVLSAVAPLSFVAKKEVGRWPFVASLARLQRTVFVDRERRSAVGETAGEITQRLAAGDTVVLFAEGTSSDGNRVLPFKTSLFAAAKPTSKSGTDAVPDAVVQTVSLVYTARHGLPLGRAGRPGVGWYGDMEMQSHAWQLLKGGPLDVHIRIGAPVALASFADRKALARHSEDEVRRNVVGLLRGPTARRWPIPARPQAAAPMPQREKRAKVDTNWV